MKKYTILTLAALASLGGRLAAQSADAIYVEGEVMNIVESIPLPFCEVQLQAGGAVVGSAKSDGGGGYVIPSMLSPSIILEESPRAGRLPLI